MVDREELIGRARDLVSGLRERAHLTEEQRQIPQETVEEFHDAGILRASQPLRFRGYALDYPVMLDIAAELGRGCGSADWCYSVWAAHNWALGMFPEKAQVEYWAESADVLAVASINPLHAQQSQSASALAFCRRKGYRHTRARRFSRHYETIVCSPI